MDVYPWIVLVHVLSAFAFVMAHGASLFVTFRVRTDSDRVRLAALLDLSGSSLTLTFVSLGVATLSGVAAAIVGGHFSQFWPWAAIGVLIVVSIVMTPLATYPLTAVRRGLGQQNQEDKKKGITPEPVGDAELAAVRARVRPERVTVIGLVGLAVLVWLMQLKPF